MNEMASQSAMMLGEIEQIMHDLSPVITDAELGNLVDVERGEAALKAFETGASTLMLPAKGETLEIAGPAKREPVPVVVNSGLSSLFERNK
jgi:hypothetical protein